MSEEARPLLCGEEAIWRHNRFKVADVDKTHATLITGAPLTRVPLDEIRRAPSREFVDRLSRGLVRAAEDIPEGYEIVETLDGMAARGRFAGSEQETA